MKHMLGYIFLDGINVAVSIVTLHHLYQSTGDQHKDELNAGIILICFGLGCVTGGYLGGKLCDIINIRRTAYLYHFFFVINCLLSIVVSEIDWFYCSCFVSYLWGYLLYYTQANEMVMCSKLFKGKTESFAIVKQFHSFSIIIYQIISMTTHNSIPVKYLMIPLIFFAFPSLYLLRGLPLGDETPLINRNDDENEIINSSDFNEK